MLVASFDLFLIELATDNGTVVHLEENEFSVDGSFVGVNTAQVVGQQETDDALPVPLLRLDGFDIRSHRISRNGISSQFADISVYPAIPVSATDPCSPFSFPLYDTVLILVF